jgi:hypothetical protein
VRFTYRHGKKIGGLALNRLKGRRITTEAEITTKDADGNIRVLAIGQSVRHPLDQFRKGVGRRFALQMATRQLPDKVLRREIWDKYFDSHRDSTELMIGDFSN